MYVCMPVCRKATCGNIAVCNPLKINHVYRKKGLNDQQRIIAQDGGTWYSAFRVLKLKRTLSFALSHFTTCDA